MKIKINCALNYEQVEELANVLAKPDLGWEVDSANEKLDKIYLVEHQGEKGTYLYRVNLIKDLITVLEVSK